MRHYSEQDRADIIAQRAARVPLAQIAEQYGTNVAALSSTLYRWRRAGVAVPRVPSTGRKPLSPVDLPVLVEIDIPPELRGQRAAYRRSPYRHTQRVKMIKELARQGLIASELAMFFAIPRSAVYDLLGSTCDGTAPFRYTKRRVRLTPDQHRKIAELWRQDDIPVPVIAKRFGLTVTGLNAVVSRLRARGFDVPYRLWRKRAAADNRGAGA